MTEEAPSYGLVIIAKQSKNLKALLGGRSRLADADMVIGKANVVLKDRYGSEGRTLRDYEVTTIRESAGEVIEL
jgi:hypothetical protein